MSISSEIERIQTAKSDLITAIENKGVTVPTGATIDKLPELIDSIPGGGVIFPTDYTPGVLVLENGSGVIDVPNELLPVQGKEILSQFYIKGGASNWTGYLYLFNLNNYSGHSVQFYIRNNLSSNKSICSATWCYNNEALTEVSIIDNLSIYSNNNACYFNTNDTWAKNGRIAAAFNNNSIRQIFQADSTLYKGSTFYYLALRENGNFTNYLLPAKKNDNSIVLLDIITGNEIPVTNAAYKFVSSSWPMGVIDKE